MLFKALIFRRMPGTPAVVDVGSVVDYPRRHCGQVCRRTLVTHHCCFHKRNFIVRLPLCHQNPVNIPECIDDVNYVKKSRHFLFQGALNVALLHFCSSTLFT